MAYPILTQKDIARFFAKAKRNETTGCLEWTGCKTKFGYGYFGASRKTLIAHRVAWTLAHGCIPAGLCVCHHCDNPPCVNTAHLFLGTRADNVADRDAKGRGKWATGDKNGSRLHPESRPRGDRNTSRSRPERLARGDRNGSRLHPDRVPRGERQHSAKLTADIVREIRERQANGETQDALAARFGVCQSVVHAVVYRKSWSHVV